MPELKNFDKKYIYEPHKAPIADQKLWKCQIKGDGREKGSKDIAQYPKPMLDFNEARQYCIDKMKEAYDAGLYGDDERVMNGEWKKIFDYSEGAVDQDETTGTVSKGQKRVRTRQEPEDDDGENADVGDEIDDKPPRKARKGQSLPGSKARQGNLDGMVTRSKKMS